LGILVIGSASSSDCIVTDLEPSKNWFKPGSFKFNKAKILFHYSHFFDNVSVQISSLTKIYVPSTLLEMRN
jgi:hypothetical protein